MIFNLFKASSTDVSNPLVITDDMKKDAKQFISTILSTAGFSAVVGINNDVTDVVYLMIEDEYETARIIGKDGQTLGAFQTILQSYMAKTYAQFVPVFAMTIFHLK